MGVAGARFVPPPVHEMTQAMDALESSVGSPPTDPPFLVQLALIHSLTRTLDALPRCGPGDSIFHVGGVACRPFL